MIIAFIFFSIIVSIPYYFFFFKKENAKQRVYITSLVMFILIFIASLIVGVFFSVNSIGDFFSILLFLSFIFLGTFWLLYGVHCIIKSYVINFADYFLWFFLLSNIFLFVYYVALMLIFDSTS